MGVLVRKRNGAWWVFTYHKGRRKAKRVGDKESAESVAKRLRVALASGALQLGRPAAPLFKDYAEGWLRQHQQVNGIKESTVRNYDKALRVHLVPVFGDMPLTAITRQAVREFIARLRAGGSVKQPGQGLKPGSVGQMLAPLRAMLNSAVEDGHLQQNPAARIGKFNKRRTEAEAEGCDPFTAGELEAAARAAREEIPLLWPLVGLWAQSGMRAGEVFGLQWRDLDLEEGTAIVRRTLSDGRLGSPKTGRARLVTIIHPVLERPEAVLKALRELRSVREAEAVLAGKPFEPEAYVFLRRDGRPWDSISYLWQRALKLAGVRYRYPEQLRHTWASTLLSRSWPLLYVQRQGGWTNAITLLKHYARWIPQEIPAQGQLVATPAQPMPVSPGG